MACCFDFFLNGLHLRRLDAFSVLCSSLSQGTVKSLQNAPVQWLCFLREQWHHDRCGSAKSYSWSIPGLHWFQRDLIASTVCKFHWQASSKPIVRALAIDPSAKNLVCSILAEDKTGNAALALESLNSSHTSKLLHLWGRLVENQSISVLPSKRVAFPVERQVPSSCSIKQQRCDHLEFHSCPPQQSRGILQDCGWSKHPSRDLPSSFVLPEVHKYW